MTLPIKMRQGGKQTIGQTQLRAARWGKYATTNNVEQIVVDWLHQHDTDAEITLSTKHTLFDRELFASANLWLDSHADDVTLVSTNPTTRSITIRGVAAAVATAQFSLHLIRSEEHTSELQSLIRNSYAVFCLT